MSPNPEAIAALLIANVPRDLVMGVEDAFAAGALQAFGLTKDVSKKAAENCAGVHAAHPDERALQ